MRRLAERWRSMTDAEMNRISENIVAIHWVLMGLFLVGWRLLPIIRGVSPEVMSGLLH